MITRRELTQKLLLILGTLINQLKQQHFALTSRKSSGKLSGHGTSDFDAVCGAFALVNFPIGKLSGVKVGDFGDRNVRPGTVVLPNVSTLVTGVDIVQERGLSRPGTEGGGEDREGGSGKKIR